MRRKAHASILAGAGPRPALRLLLLVGVSIVVLASPADAAQVEKVAGGLDNPRHLAFGGDDLYVAEAGRGGDGPCFLGPTETTVCVGATGAVTVVDDDGDQRRLVEGLASFADEGTGAEGIGPHGIYVKGENRVLVTNGGPTFANRDDLAAVNPVADLFGRLLRIQRDGSIERLADIWAFERDHNPHPVAIDSNPVDVLAHGRRVVVADAGGNTLLKASRNGTVELLSVFADRLVPDPFGSGEIPMQTVPTGVVKGLHGDYFMSQLTGFPFPVGAANVYRVDRQTGEAEVFASGFTNIMDLAFDEDGTLWVLEIDHDSLLTPIGPSSDGAIFAVDENGQKRQLTLEPGTLTHPGGITVGEDGALYVTNNADVAGEGEVLRIDLGEDEDEDDNDDDHGDDD
jgi:DNA-binding beta-propeller fold protein YncE